jgi:hypothetical protein
VHARVRGCVRACPAVGDSHSFGVATTLCSLRLIPAYTGTPEVASVTRAKQEPLAGMAV